MKKTVYKINSFSVLLELNTGKFYAGISLAVLAFYACMRAGTSLPAGIVMSCPFLVLSIFKIECNDFTRKLLSGIWTVSASFAVLSLTQLLMNAGLLQLGLLRIALGVLIISVVLLFLHICTMNCRATVIMTVVLLMGLTIANYFVVRFRGSELIPADFLAIGTAMNVAGEYDYSVDPPFIYACCLATAFSFCGFCFPGHHSRHSIKKVGLCVIAEAAMIALLFAGISSVPAYHFSTDGSNKNGYLVNFLRRLESATVMIPDGYDVDTIAEMEHQYTNRETGKTNRTPDIIMIMGEAFSDLRVLGDLKTDAEVMPFFDSLTEDTIRGYALASVFGGGTCNSEYEALTGNTLAYLPDGSYPFQQYISDESYSMGWYLKSLGYTTLATHPNIGGNWMRSSVWPLLGFDEDRYIEAYTQENLMRGYVSDLEMYKQIISWYEQRDTEMPFFLFGVTMQNHSPFDYSGSDFTSEIHLNGYTKEYPDVEQYLTLTNYSDQALEYLISYFETVENDVVVVFFGDHQPRIDTAFYEELHQGGFDSLEEQMLRYTVPFVIWANYDIEEQSVARSSLNFLSNYIFDAAGIELPAYNTFLKDVNEAVTSINAYGFYSKKENAFVSIEKAEGHEAEVLHQYQLLQYNNLFDTDNRSALLFPTS